LCSLDDHAAAVAKVDGQDEQRPADPGGSVGRSRATEPDEFFDAVERGSVDELLDAGAHSDLDAMRHSAAM